jgi:F-type H+-transporting ATPase subunit b
VRAGIKRTGGGIVMTVVTAGCMVLLAGAVFASGDAHAVDSGALLKDFLYRFLNFAIIFGALAYILAKPLRQGLGQRRAKLIETLDQANKARVSAEAKVAEYERKLGDSDREIADLLAQAKEENGRERAKVLAEAQAIADTVRKEARLCADREIERARRELRSEAAQMAIRMAEEMLRQGITDEDRARLVKENLQQMENQS